MLKKVLIANRGEIAIRIIRACKELGIKTVAIYSEADKDSLHVTYADESFCIGPAVSAKSYLFIPNIISAAKITNCDAIHPGYGFLAENYDFAAICKQHKITFIGPSSAVIKKMGDKNTARKTMIKANVPVTPGSKEIIKNMQKAEKLAEELGYPVIVKATAGGGGKGMRIVKTPDELEKQFKTASNEADKAFGNPDCYMEKYIENPRHIEIQVLADSHGNAIYLGERECSIQRRHQKLLEEAPSKVISDKLRKQMGDAAVAAALAANYVNAGTVEFLLDKHNNFYFMEMNTRLQVEHPVTEMITDFDIVKEMLKIASGEKLSITQEDIEIIGHSIECRINAEDPSMNFMPSVGTVENVIMPGGRGVRIDSHIYSGYEIPKYYDSLIAKLIVHGRDRDDAISIMKRALSEFQINGISTTIPYHLRIMDNEYFKKGEIYTDFIEKHMQNDE